MLSALLRRLTPAASRAPETKAAPLLALSLAGPASWGRRDFETLVRKGVLENAIVYRCVRMLAEAAASVPFLLYEGDQEIETHPLLALLQRPNPREDGTELMTRSYAHLQCAGNAYLRALMVEDAPRELHVLRPDRVKVLTDAGGWPLAYDYKIGDRTIRIGRGMDGFMPVLHCRLFHPLDDLNGLSPLQPAAAAIEIHNAGAGWTKALLDNAARPSGALVYKGPDGAPNLTDDQFRRLKNELADAYQGAHNAGRPMVLEGGLEWRSMSHSPAEMDFSELRDASAREIAHAFGIPPMLLGIPGDNTFANYREANLTFWRQSVLPLVARQCGALTRWLAPLYGESLRVAYDADRIEALAEDRMQQWSGIDAAGFLSINEKRAFAGYSPVSGGEGLL